MNKLLLAFLCIAACQLVHSFPAEEPTEEELVPVEETAYPEWSDDDLEYPEDPDEDEARKWWNAVFNLLKKVLKVEGLTCAGTSCRTCISAFGKSACINMGYNRQAGPKAALQVSVNAGSKTLWSGQLNAGRPAPSCLNIKFPIKTVCIQNFSVTVGSGGRPEGDLCFTVNFKSYGLGVKLCAAWRGKSLHPAAPQIIKT